MDAECFGDFSSKNSIIYGHYAQNHKMFGFLENYKLFPYYKEHPIVSIEIQSQLVEYDIFSVFVTSIDKNGFPYYNFIDFEENEDFSSYIKTVKSLSLYDTGIMPEYGDKLLTLSTCDYSKENGRLVIMAVAKTQ